MAIEPPLLLSLAEGKGPVNICANHLLEEDPEMDDEDDEAESEEMAEVEAAPVSLFFDVKIFCYITQVFRRYLGF